MALLKDWRSRKDRQSCASSCAFANLFSIYTKTFNKAYQRTGSSFEKPFRRKLVDGDRYFTHLVAYTRTRRNPVKHRFVDDFRDWPYSSYRAVLSTKPTRVQRESVLGWFGGRPGFEAAHALEVEEGVIEALIAKDWV